MNSETQAPAAPVEQHRRARGDGSIFQKAYTDKRTGAPKKTETLYMKFYVGGKPVVESTETTKVSEAKKALRRRLNEVAGGRYIAADVEKTTFGDIKAMGLDDYRANGRKSLDRFEDAVAHLNGFFLDAMRVRAITPDRITAYTAARREDGAANATINRELSALKRMLRLGERAGKVVGRPYIGMLEENNRRKGFMEDEQFEAIRSHLPEHLKAPMELAFITGWRLKSEIVTRQKSHLDMKAGWLRLEPGETKNGEGRMFPLVPRLRAVVAAQMERTREHEQKTGTIVPWLFHHAGRPIKSYRRAWLTACLKAGLAQVVSEKPRKIKPLRIPHDFRRTAVRNLERAGIPRSAAMAMVGHKTESVYRRYAIAEEGMLNEAGAKLQQLYDHAVAPTRTIVPFTTRGARG
jgi:integrase